MTRSNRTLSNRFQKATTFYEQLKLALEYQGEPDILRDYSPLAKPYFLNQPRGRGVLSPPRQAAAPVHWGAVLSAKLAEAAATLWQGTLPVDAATLFAAVETESTQRGRGSRYDYLMLELNYFKQIVAPPPQTQAEIYHDLLHISRTSHDRWLKEAVEHLGRILLQQLRPPLRLETPLLRGVVIGRAQVQARCMATLHAGGSVALTGPGGIGKSTLGAAIVESWPTPTSFWFTVRPGLNDHLNSLLFALGYFFHQQGASALWLQLVADEGKLEDANLALGLVRADIEALQTTPLLCFDEIDLLRAADLDRPNPHHLQLLGFIESLRPHLPLLLIGQRAVLESELAVTLERLPRAEMERWLQRLQINYTATELSELERYTGGNPRLLTLCFTLHQLERGGRAAPARPLLGQTLLQLPHTPAIGAIWDRLRLRLASAERRLLHALALFRIPAPKDAWLQLAEPEGDDHPAALLATLDRLTELQLVQEDAAGGLLLLPILRETLYTEMTVETRQGYHQIAAQIYAARGEYTEAAYHFHQGDQPERAIALWFPERRAEIQRGQAGAALAIVEQISAHRLQRPQQQQLALLRAELYGLLGEPQKVVESLAVQEWNREEPTSIEALRLWGEALNLQGDPAGAQAKLQEGVQVVAYLLEQHAHLHVQRGLIHLQQREMKAAWQEATRARYYAENLQGAIQANLGNYAIARNHYEVALQLATELGDTQATARTEYYLGIAAMQQQDLERAFGHYRAAIADYQRVGNRAQEVYARSNLAAAYLTAGDYPAAIAEADAALLFCRRMNAPYWMAMNAANLAEAYFALGELAAAERYALEVIEHEEVDSYPYALYTLGAIRRTQQRYADALQFFTRSCQIAAQNEDRFLLAYAQRGVGEVYAEQGAMAQAAAALHHAHALFQQLGIAAEAQRTADLLAKVVV